MSDELTDFLSALPPLRQPRKPKALRGTIQSKYDLKKLYYDARRIMFQREYPQAWAVGGYYDNKFPDISKTNGTMKYIRDVLNNLGHNADRNNTMGIPVKDERTGEITWRRSGSTTGATDMFNDIKIPSQAYPVAWKIEVKKGNDSLGKAQRRYRDKMNRIGVLHSVVYVGQLDYFWDELDRILSL